MSNALAVARNLPVQMFNTISKYKTLEYTVVIVVALAICKTIQLAYRAYQDRNPLNQIPAEFRGVVQRHGYAKWNSRKDPNINQMEKPLLVSYTDRLPKLFVKVVATTREDTEGVQELTESIAKFMFVDGICFSVNSHGESERMFDTQIQKDRVDLISVDDKKVSRKITKSGVNKEDTASKENLLQLLDRKAAVFGGQRITMSDYKA